METYHGLVRTPNDAIILFEACRLGNLGRVQRRLSEKERLAIKSGSVFVWDEKEAGMRRWTDGKSWSASRVAGSFLTYREMEGKRGGSAFSSPMQGNGKANGESHDGEHGHDGPTDGYRYKADGLIKQSFSITTSDNHHLHLISYHSRFDTSSGKLKQPTQDPELRQIRPQKGLYPESVHDGGTPQLNNRSPMTRSPYANSPSYPHAPSYLRHPPINSGYWGASSHTLYRLPGQEPQPPPPSYNLPNYPSTPPASGGSQLSYPPQYPTYPPHPPQDTNRTSPYDRPPPIPPGYAPPPPLSGLPPRLAGPPSSAALYNTPRPAEETRYPTYPPATHPHAPTSQPSYSPVQYTQHHLPHTPHNTSENTLAPTNPGRTPPRRSSHTPPIVDGHRHLKSTSTGNTPIPAARTIPSIGSLINDTAPPPPPTSHPSNGQEGSRLNGVMTQRENTPGAKSMLGEKPFHEDSRALRQLDRAFAT